MFALLCLGEMFTLSLSYAICSLCYVQDQFGHFDVFRCDMFTLWLSGAICYAQVKYGHCVMFYMFTCNNYVHFVVLRCNVVIFLCLCAVRWRWYSQVQYVHSFILRCNMFTFFIFRCNMLTLLCLDAIMFTLLSSGAIFSLWYAQMQYVHFVKRRWNNILTL